MPTKMSQFARNNSVDGTEDIVSLKSGNKLTSLSAIVSWIQTTILSGYLNNIARDWKNDSNGYSRIYFDSFPGLPSSTYVRGYSGFPFYVQRSDGVNVFFTTDDGRAGSIADAINPADFTRKGQVDAALTSLSTSLSASITSTVAVSSALSFSSLTLSATGSNSQVAVSCAELLLRDAAGNPRLLSNIAITIDSAGTGAGGLDINTLAASTWYAVWVIWNGTTTAGLLSLSSTSPTMPSGYTHKARVGWIRTDGTANKFPLGFVQAGRNVRYRLALGSNLTALPAIASGVQGNPSIPTWVAVATRSTASTNGNVPPTASAVDLMAVRGVGVSATAMAAPNSAYGSYIDNTNPPPLMASMSSPSTNVSFPICARLMLESDNVYYIADNAACSLRVLGWEDNL